MDELAVILIAFWHALSKVGFIPQDQQLVPKKEEVMCAYVRGAERIP